MQKNSIFISLVAATILLSAFTMRTATSWKIAEDYNIAFSSKDPSGVFTKMDGTIVFDENDLSAASFNVRVHVNSINTGNGMQNKHAKSDKWLDAEKYPYIQFESRTFSKTGSGYLVKGTMTMHGVSRDFEIPFTFKDKTFTGSITVNRNDFKIGSPGGSASDELTVDIRVPVTLN